MSKHLGNFSAHPYYSVPMSCSYCDVEWGGCASAADCPRCGRCFNYLDDNATDVESDEARAARETRS